jgi:DNA-binding CsgD family transcriptional regulator
MNGLKTAIISPNYLLARGLAFYINRIIAEPKIELFENLSLFRLKFAAEYFVIFIDSLLLESPADSFKILREMSEGTKLVYLFEDEPSYSVRSLFKYLLPIKLSEEEIEEKLRLIYHLKADTYPTSGMKEILSKREKEVLRCIALGKTNKAISDQLSISARTVITHLKNITAKLGIKTIAGLTVYSIINRLIDSDEMKVTKNVNE